VEPSAQRRSIRSFVVRAGRMGPGQTRALAELGPRFVLPYRAEAVDWTAVFDRDAPRLHDKVVVR
jgi:tRNA (guanine-N7-)-methyltransferase